MTRTDLYEALNYVDATRVKRTEMARLILDNSKLMPTLIDIAMVDDDPISCRACWVLEFTIKKDLSLIFPYLNKFTARLGDVHLDSSVRPIAKICEILVEAYFSKNNSAIQEKLTMDQLERIATACFDWLIGDHKVAAKAYSMTSLLLLGRKFSWVLPELKMVLEQNYANGSAAYKARARMTLAKIK